MFSKIRKSLLLLILIFIIIYSTIPAQTVTGKLVDENGIGLAEANLHLYSEQTVFHTISLEDGSFMFENVTGIIDEQLPTSYSISNNYPNPFNPRTRILISLPQGSRVKANVFNLLGESVTKEVEKYYAAGSSSIDFELNGLPNGLYFARISIDDKYTIVRKMMLVYGSQHLSTDYIGFSPSNQNYSNLKKTQETVFDSLVAESIIIGSKTFTNLPNLNEGTLDFGNLTIERYCEGIAIITYAEKNYKTVQIGDQCWLRENLNVGTMIVSNRDDDNQTDNGTIEKYCYGNDESNCNTYGGLYQWNEAMQYVITEGKQGICPSGWHIPTYTEMQTLETVNDETAKLVDESKTTSGYTATNETGFSALFGGLRDGDTGYFNSLGSSTVFGSSTETILMVIGNVWDNVVFTSVPFSYGLSIRCLKD